MLARCYSHHACGSFVRTPLDLISHIPLALRHRPPVRYFPPVDALILTCKHTHTHRGPQTHTELFPSFESSSLGVTGQASPRHKGSLNPHIASLPRRGCCLAAERQTENQATTHARTNLHTPLPKTNLSRRRLLGDKVHAMPSQPDIRLIFLGNRQ